MKVIKEKFLGLDSTVSAEELKGKRVVTKNGKDIGKIAEIRINPSDFSFAGIKVNRGLLEIDSFIGREYIDSISHDGAVLSITPVTDYLGVKVFDADGKQVGKVKEIRREGTSNNILEIVVDRGLLKSDIVVSKSDLRTVGEGIILSGPVEEDTIKIGVAKKAPH